MHDLAADTVNVSHDRGFHGRVFNLPPLLLESANGMVIASSRLIREGELSWLFMSINRIIGATVLARGEAPTIMPDSMKRQDSVRLPWGVPSGGSMRDL